MSQAPIRAAGAVVIDDLGQILVVHRPRYNDLSLPKGKLERDELAEVAAVREVAEETGIRVALEAALPTVNYRVHHHAKSVQWWRGRPLGPTGKPLDDEVDDVRWLPGPEAVQALTYDDDRTTVQSALDAGSGPAVVIVRHAKAVPRSKWQKADRKRPLNRRGKSQARGLIPLLGAFGVTTVVTSPALRCLDTVVPYARTIGTRPVTVEGLSEEGASADPGSVTSIIAALMAEARSNNAPVAICGHRPVLPEMLAAAGLPVRKLPKGAWVSRQLTRD